MSEANEEKEFEAEEKLIDDRPSAESVLKSSTSPQGTSAMRNVETPTAPSEISSDPRSRQTDDPQDQLTQLKAELTKYKDVALRSVADLDNYRKRMAREKDDAIRYANTSFLERLIPILDNFELGLQAAKAGGSQSAVQDGMVMVFKQLQEFLASCYPTAAKRLQTEGSIDSSRERGGFKGSVGGREFGNARRADITNGYKARLLRSFGSGAERKRRRYQEVLPQAGR